MCDLKPLSSKKFNIGTWVIKATQATHELLYYARANFAVLLADESLFADRGMPAQC